LFEAAAAESGAAREALVDRGCNGDADLRGVVQRMIEADGKAIKTARIVASAATDKATRLKATEAILNGKTVTDALLKEAGEAAVSESEFIADVRGSVPYKKELMKVYVRRAVSAALEGKNGAH